MKKLQRIEYQMTQANRKRHIVRDIGNTPGINQHAISLTEASTLLSGAYQTSVDVYPWAHNRVTMLAYKPTGGGVSNKYWPLIGMIRWDNWSELWRFPKV